MKSYLCMAFTSKLKSSETVIVQTIRSVFRYVTYIFPATISNFCLKKSCHSPSENFFPYLVRHYLIWKSLECFLVNVSAIQCGALKSEHFYQNLQRLKPRNNSHPFRHLEMHPKWILGEFGKLPQEAQRKATILWYESAVQHIFGVCIWEGGTIMSNIENYNTTLNCKTQNNFYLKVKKKKNIIT